MATQEYTTVWTSANGTIRTNPHVGFGRPLVVGCGISVGTLYEAIEIEGSVAEAAIAYGVDEKDIRVAQEYCEHVEKTGTVR